MSDDGRTIKDPTVADLVLTEPTATPYEKVTRFLWGDPESGEVADWVYASSSKMYMSVYGMPSGAWFRHSEQNRTFFNADILYFVLEGLLVMANPQTGEVHRVKPGDAVFFRKDTWQHGFSLGTEPVRVLEFFCPPPTSGAAHLYARTRPNLTRYKYGQDALVGRWPMAQKEAQSEFTMRVIREPDVLWRLEGENQEVLVGLLASTERLTVGKLSLLPGRKSEVRVHGGDLAIYVREGTLHAKLPNHPEPSWFELNPKDGLFVPQGTPYQLFNITGRPLEAIFGVAPQYLDVHGV
jgi:mannose-6-phosphate isomerase-like protein (cupin superfamily)